MKRIIHDGKEKSYQELITIFNDSNREFINAESNNIISGVHERNLCSNLKSYLDIRLKRSKYKNYYVDVEYNRNDGNVKTLLDEKLQIVSITCDLIVHSRGENVIQDNLICLEMKKSTNSFKEKEKDKMRLRCLTKKSYDDVWSYDGKTLPKHVCGYKLGIYYEIDIKSKNVQLEFYQEGKEIGTKTITF